MPGWFGALIQRKMVKNGKIAPEKIATECPFECGGGGVIAIWAMPK